MQNLIEKIESFYILSTNEEQVECDDSSKILYFYPENVSDDAQKIQVGLSEAVIKFMTTFSTEPCDVLQTQSKRHVFYEPEKGYWMVMVVKRPYTTKPLSTCDLSKHSIEPNIVSDILKCTYRMIKMFIGPFKDANHEEISHKCNEIIPAFLSSKKLYDDICDIFQGVNYMLLDKKVFLKVLCFIDLIEVKYSDFKCVSFLYDGQMIWNCLNPKDMLSLYQYLVDILLPNQMNHETEGSSVETVERQGRYLLLKKEAGHKNYLQSLPKVYVALEDTNVSNFYYLIVYCSSKATISFIIEESKNLELETLKSLESFIAPHMSNIALALSEESVASRLHSTNIAKTENGKFLYFNRTNLDLRSSDNIKQSQTSSVKPEVLSIIAEMHRDTKSLGDHGEITIKTPDECWITGKASNEREFYVIIQEKDANLKDISDRVKKICDGQMKNKFFYPL